jgi:hypothetical protein
LYSNKIGKQIKKILRFFIVPIIIGLNGFLRIQVQNTVDKASNYEALIVNIKQLFESNKGILSIKHLQSQGINYYALNKLLKSQKVERIKPGLYRWMVCSDISRGDVFS